MRSALPNNSMQRTEPEPPLMPSAGRTLTPIDMAADSVTRSLVDVAKLPDAFPTHRHDPAFWEMLGRTVATFGFLEEALGKAIFALTATRPYNPAEGQPAYEAWLPKLEHALTDALGNLIDVYGKSVREHPSATLENLDELLADLRKAAEMRNILCHGSWRAPDGGGASVPFYVDRKKQIVETAMNREFLARVQRHVAELACAVVNSVTHMGFQFPGSGGPGKPIV